MEYHKAGEMGTGEFSDDDAPCLCDVLSIFSGFLMLLVVISAKIYISELCWSLLPCHPHFWKAEKISIHRPKEILKLMDAVVTGDEVKRGKPQ